MSTEERFRPAWRVKSVWCFLMGAAAAWGLAAAALNLAVALFSFLALGVLAATTWKATP